MSSEISTGSLSKSIPLENSLSKSSFPTYEDGAEISTSKKVNSVNNSEDKSSLKLSVNDQEKTLENVDAELSLEKNTSELSTPSDFEISILTPWEKWFIKKIKEERRTKQNQIVIRRHMREELNKKKEEKNEKQKYIQQVVGQWNKEKNELAKLKKIQTDKQKKEFDEKQEEKKQEYLLRSSIKCSEWLLKKTQLGKETLKNKVELLKIKENQQIGRKEKNLECLKKWEEDLINRPKPLFQPFGYLEIKRPDRWERHCKEKWYPVPNFYNPNPWVSPAEKPSNSASTSTAENKDSLKKGDLHKKVHKKISKM